jgi:spore maturation protein CgeB
MRILILDNMPRYWLEVFYKQSPELAHKSYAEQIDGICENQTAHLIWALRKLGHEAMQVYPDCMPLQQLYASEKGIQYRHSIWENPWLRRGASRLKRVLGANRAVVPSSQMKIWQSQLSDYQPDVVYCVAMQTYPEQFVQAAHQAGAFTVGQIASQFRTVEAFRSYDLIVSSLPNFVENFRRNGLHSTYIPLGFGSEALEYLDPAEQGTINRLLHIGGYGPIHQERNAILEELARNNLVDCYGYGIEATMPKSPLRSVYHGPVAGMETYRLRHRYTISVTKHISKVSGPYVNNTTMFETTGVGACLLVDDKQNLADFFLAGIEVATYRTTQECLEKACYYLNHPDERKQIAEAGQRRTLKEHTMVTRAQSILKEIEGLR